MNVPQSLRKRARFTAGARAAISAFPRNIAHGDGAAATDHPTRLRRVDPSAAPFAEDCSTPAPSAKSVPSVDTTPEPPCIELITINAFFAAILIPRELTQSQLLTVEILKRVWHLPQPKLAEAWQHWRIYASEDWSKYNLGHRDPARRPTGTKLYFHA